MESIDSDLRGIRTWLRICALLLALLLVVIVARWVAGGA
jgi:hypothetical protein